MTPRAAGFLAALEASASVLAAQSMHDFNFERARRGEDRLRATIEFGAGSLVVRPATTGALYRLQLHYDAERYLPLGSYDADRGAVRLGV